MSSRPRPLGRRVAASAAVALASLTGALAFAGPASATTPCPPDVCDPPAPVVIKKKWPFPGPNPCLSCPRDRVTEIKDLIINPVLDRGLELQLELETLPQLERGLELGGPGLRGG